MNRRNFFKSLGAVCGAIVMCPAVLLKAKSEREILIEKFRAALKNTKFKTTKCYGKHGQRCVCNNCIDDMMVDCLPPLGRGC